MRLIDADALFEAIEIDHRNKRDIEYGDWLYQKDALSIITNAPTVQSEGWKLVPIEPTDKMWQDAFDIYNITYHGGCQMTDEIMRIKAIYKSMLAAAPTDKE